MVRSWILMACCIAKWSIYSLFLSLLLHFLRSTELYSFLMLSMFFIFTSCIGMSYYTRCLGKSWTIFNSDKNWCYTENKVKTLILTDRLFKWECYAKQIRPLISLVKIDIQFPWGHKMCIRIKCRTDSKPLNTLRQERY